MTDEEDAVLREKLEKKVKTEGVDKLKSIKLTKKQNSSSTVTFEVGIPKYTFEEILEECKEEILEECKQEEPK